MLAQYRKGILIILWTAGISGVLLLISLILWGLLSLLGDLSGAVVARVITLLLAMVTGLDLIALVLLLARLQLVLLNEEDLATEE